jgi:hypothetical protein
MGFTRSLSDPGTYVKIIGQDIIILISGTQPDYYAAIIGFFWGYFGPIIDTEVA